MCLKKWYDAQYSGLAGLPVGQIVSAILFGLLFAAAPVRAQEAGQRGIDVFEAVCANCHLKGDNGAPRIGDRAAWAGRTAQGLGGLTRNALTGIRKMPPHGGDASLSHLELQRAIVYIINQSGGNWVEPAGTGTTAGKRSGAQIVQARCSLCHATGFDGAPRIGDRMAWAQRTTLGIDRLVRVAARGHRGMPPRGGDPSLTDAELRSAVIYMASSAGAWAAADRDAKAKR